MGWLINAICLALAVSAGASALPVAFFLAVMMSDSPHSNMTEAKALLIITCIVAVPFAVTWFATKFMFKMLAREMRREE